MENFRIVRPSFVLTPFVRYYWLLESDSPETQRIIPTGNIELVFHRGNRMTKGGNLIPRGIVSGQGVSFFDLIPTGSVRMLVVVFQPFGARAFFDVPLHLLSGKDVSVDDLSIRPLKELKDQILDTDDDDTCIRMIEDFLIGRLKPVKEYNHKRMSAALNEINLCDGNVSVSHLAEKVYLSNKQFSRLFNEHVGLMPKEFMRVVRFHKALFMLQHHPTMSFAQLAYECGYYDQSHLINEFKAFSGYTPREYLSVCAPYSDYFSH